ncbi:hypothetical protein J4407_01510 [Candidatus Pacearchaeota archaeon]|nr:hypothetical protein [Candidatus Pacearchaeota archaeon]
MQKKLEENLTEDDVISFRIADVLRRGLYPVERELKDIKEAINKRQRFQINGTTVNPVRYQRRVKGLIKYQRTLSSEGDNNNDLEIHAEGFDDFNN